LGGGGGVGLVGTPGGGVGGDLLNLLVYVTDDVRIRVS
jgi:hypothetical protein